jgi:hypothetical protein
VIFFGLGLLGLFFWQSWGFPEFTSPPQATQGSDQAIHSLDKATLTPSTGMLEILPTPSPDVTAAPPALFLKQNAFCRKGPGTAYKDVTTFEKGQSLQIDGQNETLPRWWWVLIPDTDQHCWISDAAGTASGPADSARVIHVAPPAGSSASGGGGAGAPAAPSNLAITSRVCTSSNYSVTLGWQDNANNETGFRVYRNGTLIATRGANATSYTDNPPGSGPYTYGVEAFNAAGASARPTVNEAGCLY